jgi:hypothetical protein
MVICSFQPKLCHVMHLHVGFPTALFYKLNPDQDYLNYFTASQRIWCNVQPVRATMCCFINIKVHNNKPLKWIVSLYSNKCCRSALLNWAGFLSDGMLDGKPVHLMSPRFNFLYETWCWPTSFTASEIQLSCKDLNTWEHAKHVFFFKCLYKICLHKLIHRIAMLSAEHLSTLSTLTVNAV